MTDSGYTLPVFAVAAAKAALQCLLSSPTDPSPQRVALDLLSGDLPSGTGSDGVHEIEIEQVARLDEVSALGITRSDPGANLDLTRQTPIWAWVGWGQQRPQGSAQGSAQPHGVPWLDLQGGEGLGRRGDGSPAIYDYAQRLFVANLEPLRPIDRSLWVRIILPQGRRLAQRTSNVAFGVLEGLALVGTSGIPQPAATQDYLEQARLQIPQILAIYPEVVVCIGSHGRQVAERLGAQPGQIVQGANWIGALLVEAALRGAGSVRLIGYHGKLIKLAGGIFNTSSHVADGRLEILAAAALRVGAGADLGRQLLQIQTVEQGQQVLEEMGLAAAVFQEVALRIQERTQAYIRKYAERDLPLSVVLFDRRGRIWGCRD